MIKTDILVCDDITKEKAFFTAKDLQEVKKVKYAPAYPINP